MDRIHRAVSADGTEIAGRVHGEGPPLVLVHGGLEDGDLDWAEMLPLLTDRFTCYLMSIRSRGLSEHSIDLSPPRRLEDVIAFVDSIGESVSVFGESDGGRLALGAAAGSDSVAAVAVHEPVVFDVMGEEDGAQFEDTLGRVGEAAADGRLIDAARIFSEMLANDDELAALTDMGYFNECARYIPTLLAELEQEMASDAPDSTDPSQLAQVTVPVLVMHGSGTALNDFFNDGVAHVAEHVADARVREIDGSGHFGVALAPQAIAEEVGRFLATASQSV